MIIGLAVGGWWYMSQLPAAYNAVIQTFDYSPATFNLQKGQSATSKDGKVTITFINSRIVHDSAPEMGGGDHTLVDVSLLENGMTKSVTLYSGMADSVTSSISVHPEIQSDGSVVFSVTHK
ncbi:MAG: hypothetical protein JWO43_522 [Candidatus Adlerbacteria bacterium]|nr:hypothetical protein [Candidatus Adlerbacteria bacterium]